jgi:hypothetical protein
MFQKNFTKLILIAFVFSALGCQRTIFQSPTVAPATLRDVSAIKLNFRFETDVPAPTVSPNKTAQSDERNAAVQTDFDQNRTQELLDRTIASPDRQRILAVYRRVEDLPSEFRLDMYLPDGKLLRKITPDTMAVHFADTIVWSSDSANVAFVAMVRIGGGQPNAAPASPSPTPMPATEDTANTSLSTELNAEANANAANVDANAAVLPTPVATVDEAAKNIFTFRTEQLYVCNAEGGELKAITQNEGLIYFYFVWSPDGSSLAALAETFQEWNYTKAQADAKGEIFLPAGRLRLVEKTGRERRLDDNLTTVRPVWSPDSAKVAIAFNTQVRIYDTIGDAPTQAAIPLRNQLLISSKSYDEEAQRKEESANINTNINSNAPATNSNTNTTANTNANTTINQPLGTLPDENMLVSFNPIINLEWSEDKMLYLQTGYVKEYKNEGDSRHSYLRWHRLIFSPQAIALGK